MKKLHEIVKERFEKQQELSKKQQEFEKLKEKLTKETKTLLELENVAESGLDLNKVQVAENLLYISGNPYGKADHKFNAPTIAELAIIDIAENFKKLRTEYFGNKRYESYYQRCNCEYGMGPRHGSIVDQIGLKDRKYVFTDEEKDACIYYIKNYGLIKESKNKLPHN